MCYDEKNERTENYIIETVKRIDQLQKEVVIGSVSSCITCETSLITRANNTIPVTFYTQCGIFEAITDLDGTTTSFFRIECLRDERFVTLRLLTLVDGALTATTRTVILDLNCVCALQCFEPIDTPDC